MKKFLLSLCTIIAFALYVASERASGTGSGFVSLGTPAAVPTNSSQETAPAPASSGVAAESGGSAPKPKAVASTPARTNSSPRPAVSSGSNSGSVAQGRYKNGTYTGATADAFYGNVQVRVTVSNGQIADVQFLQYPQDRSTSQYINSQATPVLRSEAIQAQSAQVDIVSGATATSQAFQQSLTSALVQAKA